ncbi:TPA: hydrolase, partial [Enterococcus faecium]|nr:hydrolase [Enterococcus faecium]
MSNLWDYNQEAPIHYLIARHWDALKIEAVCRSLLAAVPKQQLENFLVADSLQREKVQ